jgi:hypothetical protein
MADAASAFLGAMVSGSRLPAAIRPSYTVASNLANEENIVETRLAQLTVAIGVDMVAEESCFRGRDGRGLASGGRSDGLVEP